MASTDFVVSDVRIFTGTDTIESGHVIVKDGLISSVSAGPAPSDTDLRVISKPGHTVVPGFIDSHIHATKGDELALTQSFKFGVTTVMDMGNETYNVLKLKEFAAANRDVASDFKASGRIATVKNGWPMPVVTAHDKTPETLADIATWAQLDSVDTARAYVKENLSPSGGGDYTKVMNESGFTLGQTFPKASTEIQKALIDATHAAGSVAVAHAFSYADTLEMLQLGINGTAHAFVDEPIDQQMIDAFKKAKAWCNPTLALIGSFTRSGRESAKRITEDPRVKAMLSVDGHAKMCECVGLAKKGLGVQNSYNTVRRLREEGVPVIVGTDATAAGMGLAWGASFHHEMYIFVEECGFTPKEALHAGTALIADLFGWNDRGRVAPGLKADLVLLEGNPVEDIHATLNIRSVWRDGILAKEYVE